MGSIETAYGDFGLCMEFVLVGADDYYFGMCWVGDLSKTQS